ncbi:MAG: EF-hand domain-containing protein [Planctomycetota bacterium]
MRLLVLIPLALFATELFAQGRGGRGGSPWERLKGMDADGDGKVSKDEFQGPDRFWDRLDADSDGFVTKDEAQNMRRGNRQRGGGGGAPGGSLMPAFDADGDGKVSSDEWQAFFKRADKNGDGTVSSDELMQALRGGGSGADRRGPDRAPKEGTDAPKVSAAAFKGGAKIDLAKPKRTTVLVFGSYT